MAHEDAAHRITRLLGVAAERLHESLQSDFILIVCQHGEVMAVGISSTADDVAESNGRIKAALGRLMNDLDAVPGDGTVTETTGKH